MNVFSCVANNRSIIYFWTLECRKLNTCSSLESFKKSLKCSKINWLPRNIEIAYIQRWRARTDKRNTRLYLSIRSHLKKVWGGRISTRSTSRKIGNERKYINIIMIIFIEYVSLYPVIETQIFFFSLALNKFLLMQSTACLFNSDALKALFLVAFLFWRRRTWILTHKCRGWRPIRTIYLFRATWTVRTFAWIWLDLVFIRFNWSQIFCWIFQQALEANCPKRIIKIMFGLSIRLRWRLLYSRCYSNFFYIIHQVQPRGHSPILELVNWQKVSKN